MIFRKKRTAGLSEARSESSAAKTPLPPLSIPERIARLEEKEKRLEALEAGLAQHEILLAKKVRDMNKLEAKLDSFAGKDELSALRKELKRLEEHENLIFENSRLGRELLSELAKIKESHRMTRAEVFKGDTVKRSEFDDRFDEFKDALEEFDELKKAHSGKAAKKELEKLKHDLSEHLLQLEYQNKLILRFLKELEERIQKP